MKKKRKTEEKRLIIKMSLCIIYLILITILSVCSYKLYENNNKTVSWSKAKRVDDYTYIDISKMSEKFAYYEEANIGIHFVIEKEETGQWHTYLIAINEDDYDKYKSIIDYTYERTDVVPEIIRVHGYPVITKDDLKELAIKNIPNFVPAENEVTITKDNYDTYLTNSYLDTTKEKKEEFSILLLVTLALLIIIIGQLLLTIIDKNNLVNNIDKKIKRK